MTKNLKYCITLLRDNEHTVRKEAERILLKLCYNILKYPNEMNYRKIHLANASISNKLLPATGAIECLFEAGFIENDDGFLLPINASLAGIKELCSLLNNTSPREGTSSSTAKETIKPSESNKDCPMEPKEFKSTNVILELSREVLRYENVDLQNKVKTILPLEKLQIDAIKNLRAKTAAMKREGELKNVTEDAVYEDFLLAELLSWFKFKFFKWFDKPFCKLCNNQCKFIDKITSPHAYISNIEIYVCLECGCKNEFPRYIDPEQLLYTRQGRCGEWANCFTLICRTVGFDARLIYDVTDHVWTEVWSIAHNRWIHADPCENAMDQPLLYEKGWGKKLTYVIALSKDEIQDVTWRYTRDFNSVMKRRRNSRMEESVMITINKLNKEYQNCSRLSEARKKFVIKRSALELADMLLAPPGCKKPSEALEDNSQYGGRTSGSLSWRMARGEVDDKNFKPNQWNIPIGTLNYEFKYYIVKNTYVTKDILNDKVIETKENWKNGIAALEGKILRKEEEDWQKVYLARSPGTTSCKLTWNFVLEDSKNMCIDSMKLQAITATFKNGIINWEVKGIYVTDDLKENDVIIPITNSENFETNNLKGAIKISVSATLSGGEGDTAWQHAQLFRQNLKANPEEPSINIKIYLRNK